MGKLWTITIFNGKTMNNHHVYYGISISRVYQWNIYESMVYLLLVGGFKHDFWIVHFIYGMSSFPLTNAYFSRWLKPPTSYMSLYYKLFLFFSRHVLRFVWLFWWSNSEIVGHLPAYLPPKRWPMVKEWAVFHVEHTEFRPEIPVISQL